MTCRRKRTCTARAFRCCHKRREHWVNQSISGIRTLHYKVPQPPGVTAASGLLTLTPPQGTTLLLAFTSCQRFIGRFFLRPGSIEVLIDTENLEIGPGESWALEEFLFLQGPDAPSFSRIVRSHQQESSTTSFPGTGGLVLVVLLRPSCDCEKRAGQSGGHRQADSGAQAHPTGRRVSVGDGRLAGDGKPLAAMSARCWRQIQNRGFEPAIWVAPFIAEAARRCSDSIRIGSFETVTGSRSARRR